MKFVELLTLFTLLFCSCNIHGENTQLQTQYWQYISVNGTTPLFFQTVNTFVDVPNRGKTNKTGIINKNVLSVNEQLSARWQSVLPPFVINSKNIQNEQCRRDSEQFLKHLTMMNLWAVKMHDSSGKLPSGLLNGNINQFGDFDQCLSIEENDLNIKGKYCLAYLQVRPKGNDFSKDILKAFRLMQSHFAFKSKLTDPGHRVPRFSTISWGLCVPHSCSHKDVESHLKDITEKFSNGTGFDVEVRVESEMCQEKKPFKVSISFFIVSFFFLTIITLSCLATAKDIFAPEENTKTLSVYSVLNCFSFKRNGKALMSLSRSSDDIECIHGIRMINAVMLLISHKSMALFFMPYSNRTSMVEKLSQPWCMIARVASLYTDCFVMISGLLTSYSFIKTLKKDGRLDLKNEYLSRLIRIVPPLAAIILLSTFIIPELGSGPQWNLTVSHHADKCRKTWWKNFFFIHNYLGFENMCLTHTHHLGIDTQLFFMSPILVYILYKSPLYGGSALVGLAAISTAARYLATASKNLSFFIYPGIPVSQMFDTANHSYIIPFHRLTVYIMGILLGYVLRLCGKEYRMKSHFLRIGWTVTLSLLSYVFSMANKMNHSDYVYNNKDASLYAALAPIACCLLLGWLTFVSYIGSGGVINRILSSKYCLIWTRLSYAVYLTQFPIFFFNVGLQKYPQQYSIFLIFGNILEYFGVLVASAVLTLLFDMPFNNMKKLFLKSFKESNTKIVK